jgi:hypothetical protein
MKLMNFLKIIFSLLGAKNFKLRAGEARKVKAREVQLKLNLMQSQ